MVSVSAGRKAKRPARLIRWLQQMVPVTSDKISWSAVEVAKIGYACYEKGLNGFRMKVLQRTRRA